MPDIGDFLTGNSQFIDLSTFYIRKIDIYKFALCEIPSEFRSKLIQKVSEKEEDIYINTGTQEWLVIRNKKVYRIESEGKLYNVWLCKIVDSKDVPSTIIDPQFGELSDSKESTLLSVPCIYARCNRSMKFLDKLNRHYIKQHDFNKNNIVAIKSVAGSGKTTTLLDMAKIHHDKKILYIAFNRSLILEIKSKLTKLSINNLHPKTFDSLMRDTYIKKTQSTPNLVDLRAQTIGNVDNWFKDKPYKIRDYYAKNYNKFCRQMTYNNTAIYSKALFGQNKPLLNRLWLNTVNKQFATFDSMRKLAQVNRWCKDYLDEEYDMIFIDEAQDFDPIMLHILLNDTSIPKLFVGDPLQAIYQWRGCINSFDKLPKSTLTLEFYSTFRIGEPACSQIRDTFDNCWMMSKNKNSTEMSRGSQPSGNYVYLFRTWQSLLNAAQTIPNVWINNYAKQIQFIKNLHKKLQIAPLTDEEMDGFSDDLPAFLMKLTQFELDMMITGIDRNLVTKQNATCMMYTVHTYKGLEHTNIRLSQDVYKKLETNEENNIYYVALTRGMRTIHIDTSYLD